MIGEKSATAAATTPAAAKAPTATKKQSPENADYESLEEAGEKSVMAAAARPAAANTSAATGKLSNKRLPSNEAEWRLFEDMLIAKYKT